MPPEVVWSLLNGDVNMVYPQWGPCAAQGAATAARATRHDHANGKGAVCTGWRGLKSRYGFRIPGLES